MKQPFFIGLLLLFFTVQSYAQHTPPALEQKIQGKKNLKEIMTEVEKYYAEEEAERENLKRTDPALFQNNHEAEEEEFENGLLHWKRWEWFNQSRLKENGDLEDVQEKTYTAWKKTNQQYGMLNRPMSGTNAQWNFVGPWNMQYQGGLYRGLCRIDRIVFHPTDPNTFYTCSVNGGLWRTQDGGNNWINMNFYFPIQSASHLAINPDNTNNLFAITGYANGGSSVSANSCDIWVTYDAGGNWYKTNFNSTLTSNASRGNKIVFMPGFTNVLLAATSNGLYRSTDFGNNWTQIIFNPIFDIEFDPSNPANVYASGFGRFYKSTDYGASFPANQQTFISGATRIEIGVSPNNNNYVYLLCGPYTGAVNAGNPPAPTFVGTSSFGGVYRSTDKGNPGTFNLRRNNPNILCDASNGIVTASDAGDQSGYDLAIDVSKTNAEEILAAGKIVWKSTDGGGSFFNLTPYNEGNNNATPPANYIHPDIQDIAYNPLNNIMYAATDGGIYRSTNGGTVWANITNGIHTSTFYHMAGAAFDANKIMGGTQDNGVKYKKDANDFTHVTGADGFDCSFGPTAGSSIYATVNSSLAKFDMNGTELSITTPANTAFFPVIAVNPANTNEVYLVGGAASLTNSAGTPIPPCGVQKSINGGSTWTQVLNQNIQQSICVCPNNSSRLYVTGTNSIYRSDNNGTSWSTNLALNSGFPGSGSITDINVCTGNSDLVFVTIGGFTANRKVYYSSNAGASWLNVSGTLPAELNVNCVAVDLYNNAYIGTDMGVFYQSAVNSDWTPYFNDLPRVPVTDLVIHQASSKIRASTYGHGIWETGLFTTCDADLNLAGYIAGEKFYQVSNDITSNATITGADGTIVTTRAGHEIVLSDGFTVTERNTYNGVLGGCETSPAYPRTAKAFDSIPSFMSRIDQGDSTTIYRYGYLYLSDQNSNTATLNINAVITGDFLVIITNKNADFQYYSSTETIAAQTTITKTLNLSPFETGKYFIQLYHQGKLVHVQELNIP